MDSSLKQEFTRRLSQCNRGELIVIMYDIGFAYMEEAKQAYDLGQYEAYKHAIKRTQDTLDSLIHGLDFKYGISKELYKLYVYAKNCLSKAIYQNRLDGLIEAEKILKRLYTSFCEAAKSDASGPIMQNTQQVYAGMTYGKNTLNENFYEDNHRGFFV
ncbi:MAG: flagellar protein FliS [Agathobacter sp.]|nr:flagellar protein FliS [Agathobacter sp.]